MLRPMIHLTFICLILITTVSAIAETTKKTPLTAEYILQQELLLNQLIVNIYLLQIDFLNNEAREKIQDNLTLLDTTIPNLPTQEEDGEVSGLLLSTKALWPVVSRHTSWMGNLSKQSRPPRASGLLMALAKLDRQMLLLRQKLITQTPRQDPSLRLLEQALLMQRLSREYLHLVMEEKEQRQESKAVSGKMQLKTLANHFDQRLNQLNDQYGKHPYASKPMKQAQAAWLFIAKTIQNYPKQPVPETIALYSDRIVSKLTSIHNMF